MEKNEIKRIFESIIMASSGPITVEKLLSVFEDKQKPEKKLAREALSDLQEDYAKSSVELKEVSSGYRFQVRKDYSEWVAKLWEDKPARYSRALLETIALIAYKQPITRGEIEKVRGVSVSSSIIKTLQEREWVTIVGHRDVPGKPALYATTKDFLDYFNLKSLEEMPSLAELRDIDKINGELELPEPGDTDNNQKNNTEESEPQENDTAHEDGETEAVIQLETGSDEDGSAESESISDESQQQTETSEAEQDDAKGDEHTEALTAEQ